MCLACEENDLYFRWTLLQSIAKGEMPEGMTEDDLRALDLPLPGEVELVEEPDGTKVLQPKAPKSKPAEPSAPAANPFSCDSPE